MKHAIATVILLCSSLLLAPRQSIAQEPTQAAATVSVDESHLGAGVENRMITGEDSTFTVGSKVFLWLKVTGGASSELTVTWKHGETTHSTILAIGGSPWRTWASKTVGTAGEWTVSVTDGSGTVLKEMTFTVH